MEFSLLVGDMSFFVFCKFERVIFKIVQVMTENIPFAFLYVLSIDTCKGYFNKQLQCFITRGDCIIFKGIPLRKHSHAINKDF